MTIEQLGHLAKNRFPDNPEYKGKSDREVGEMLVVKHRAYRGRHKVDFSKKKEPAPEKKTEKKEEKKYPHMPKGYKPEGAVMYDKPIGPEPAPEKGTIETGFAPVDAAGNIGLGITKGVASSFLGMASLPHSVGKWLAEKFTGKPAPEAFQKTIRQKVEESGSLEAKGKWEKIGKGGEQLAEFFAPTPVGKSKGIAAGIKILNKLKKPAIVEKAIIKSAPVVSRMAREGAKFGGVVAVQEGEIGKEAKEAAMLGAAFPLGGAITKAGILKIISPVKTKIKDIPSWAWEKILKRSPAEIQKAPELAKDISKLEIVGKSRGEIYDKLSSKIIASNKLIDKMLATQKDVKVPWQEAPITITKYANIKEMVKSLEELKASYAKIPGEAASVKAVEKIIADIKPYAAMTAAIAQELKKALYKMTSSSYNKGFLEIPAKKEAQKILAREIKKQLEILAPGVKNENTREGILIGARDAIEKAMSKAESKSPIGLTDILAGGMYLSGSGPSGIFAALGLRAMDTPMFLSGISKIVKYFETLPPIKQAYYYETLKTLTAGYEMLTRKKE